MLKLLVLAWILAAAAAVRHPPFKVIFEWKTVNFNWPSYLDEEQAKNTNEYVAANNGLAGMKLWKNKLYLSIPRQKTGIPVSLAVTSATPVNGNISPKLDAYPNWEMQSLGNCNALQLVQGMEIDPLGRMWVLDAGRSEIKTSNPIIKCQPRLVIFDLENNGKILLSYEFPDDVANKSSSFLDDIVLDHTDGGWAYITDNGAADPGIIVYSLKDNTSWKVRNNASMNVQAEAQNVTVQGVTFTSGFILDGIALSPPGSDRRVYYSPVSSFHLYSITTSVLKNPALTDVSPFITDLGRKEVQKDGMVMTNQHSLYIALLPDNAVGEWNPTSHLSFSAGFRTVARDRNRMVWPDTFGIDENGSIWLVTTNHQKYLTNQVNTTEVNYRIWRSDIRQKNYQYFPDGSAPKLPLIHNAPISAKTYPID